MDADSLTNPVIFLQSIIAHHTISQAEVSGTFAQLQVLCQTFHYRKIENIPDYRACWIVYTNRRPIIRLPADR